MDNGKGFGIVIVSREDNSLLLGSHDSLKWDVWVSQQRVAKLINQDYTGYIKRGY